ncbi:MAG TPA: DUF2993 domain-containing protein [Micromonosporaceae bacterium]|nr:DUF2993 domain-containing protein [Micromonosporaceae bacterium]
MARRGRRVAISLIVVLVVLSGLLVAADRVAAYAAEKTIAKKVAQQTKDLGIESSAPEVTIGGFPFLTQVADGRYQDIAIVLRNVSKNGVTLPVLDVHATGITATMDTLMSGNGPVTADKVVGTGTVRYDSVRAVVNQPGLELTESGGRLRLRWPVTISGQQVTATAVGDVTVNAGTVQLKVSDIKAEGITLPAIAQRLLDDYAKKLSVAINLQLLPFHLRLESVRALPEGLAISASAQGVPISG